MGPSVGQGGWVKIKVGGTNGRDGWYGSRRDDGAVRSFEQHLNPTRTERAVEDPEGPADGEEQAVGPRQQGLVLDARGELEGEDGCLRPLGVAPGLLLPLAHEQGSAAHCCCGLVGLCVGWDGVVVVGESTGRIDQWVD